MTGLFVIGIRANLASFLFSFTSLVSRPNMYKYCTHTSLSFSLIIASSRYVYVCVCHISSLRGTYKVLRFFVCSVCNVEKM